jgi:hypothetical protein
MRRCLRGQYGPPGLRLNDMRAPATRMLKHGLLERARFQRLWIDQTIVCPLSPTKILGWAFILLTNEPFSAARGVRAFGYRPVDERAIDLVRERLHRFLQCLGECEFRKNRRVRVRAVVLLVTDALGGNEAAAFQARKLALHHPISVESRLARRSSGSASRARTGLLSAGLALHPTQRRDAARA